MAKGSNDVSLEETKICFKKAEVAKNEPAKEKDCSKVLERAVAEDTKVGTTSSSRKKA